MSMDSYRTNKEIIEQFCFKNMSTHTDWTGTCVETKEKCESVEEFVNRLMEHIENNHWKV
jgi:hypothetical protein